MISELTIKSNINTKTDSKPVERTLYGQDPNRLSTEWLLRQCPTTPLKLDELLDKSYRDKLAISYGEEKDGVLIYCAEPAVDLETNAFWENSASKQLTKASSNISDKIAIFLAGQVADDAEAHSIFQEIQSGRLTYSQTEAEDITNGRWYGISAFPIRMSIQDKIDVAIKITDITEQKLRDRVKQLEYQLLKAEAIIPTVQDIAHDLRSPLTIISGFAQLLTKDCEKNDTLNITTVDTCSKYILTGANRLEQLITEALDQLEYLREPKLIVVDANEFLSAATTSKRAFISGDTELKVTQLNESVNIKIDEGKFLRALGVFIFNAEQAGATKIDLYTNAINGVLTISVIDNGPGMSPEDLKNCMIDGFSKKGSSGKGIGMAKKNIEDCGGILYAPTSELGKGTTFSFSIPISR
ncbi:MAG: HAMP domain-containing sensor histidine kinase [Candidatus Daviesbacteria bacterium]|nr:HAMP domain-containing sensor histidine kinase [Candidatus Daviesbacteria bacterium]